MIGNAAYTNTCAIRVSLALIKCGVNVRGRIAIKRGDHKGNRIEPGQAKLARLLAETAYLGTPEKFKKADAEAGIGTRKGVISFWSIPGYLNGTGGHIDIISPALGNVQTCGSGCFWTSSDVWFWPLT
ncbi:T6SS effector amidase Tae4 family protein [Caldimonas brevitalea]|uniref:T6SS effector amidase Tae4 family protein n=1 Tax=Caldimonas brevitalea TaxID=413882 RepID=UPI0009F9A625